MQAIYDNAAKELHDKRKEEPPTKLGPISKQIAAKAKLRPGMVVVKCIKVRLVHTYIISLFLLTHLDYNPLMGDSGTCAPRRTARQSAAGG